MYLKPLAEIGAISAIPVSAHVTTSAGKKSPCKLIGHMLYKYQHTLLHLALQYKYMEFAE